MKKKKTSEKYEERRRTHNRVHIYLAYVWSTCGIIVGRRMHCGNKCKQFKLQFSFTRDRLPNENGRTKCPVIVRLHQKQAKQCEVIVVVDCANDNIPVFSSIYSYRMAMQPRLAIKRACA